MNLPSQEYDMEVITSKDQAVLSWNGERTVVIDRSLISDSCRYLKSLMEYDFIERTKDCIEILIDVPFEVFKFALEFAQSIPYDYEDQTMEFWLGALELASMWLYDKLMEEVEIILIDKISIYHTADILTAANIFDLKELQKHCRRYISRMESISGIGLASYFYEEDDDKYDDYRNHNNHNNRCSIKW